MSITNKLIVILGPTASGKSELALKLALRLRSGQARKKFGIKGAEIVSADSRQIYREMNIGTAKIPRDKKSIRFSGLAEKARNNKLRPVLIKKIPHYLIDIINPNNNFSVAEYKKLAIRIIRDIQTRGKIPILAGGTGLYISAIVDNIEIPKVKPNPALRKKLEKIPLNALLKRLKKLDPYTFKIIDKNNKRRIIRALEVTISTGKPFSAQREKGAPLFDILEIGIDIPRKKLYKKIDQRVEKMINPEHGERVNGERSRTIKDNLIKETKRLLKKYSWNLPAMSGIGYKEIEMYLRGEITLERAKELIKFATHAYARRQITWFKKDKRIKWIKTNKNGFDRVIKYCKSFLLN
jgi:tRNA dimethylallyltransferase